MTSFPFGWKKTMFFFWPQINMCILGEVKIVQIRLRDDPHGHDLEVMTLSSIEVNALT